MTDERKPGPRCVAIYTEVWECAKCKRWAYRALKAEGGGPGGKGWQCDYCLNTSVRLRGPGRPLGPKCRVWARELEWFLDLMLDCNCNRRSDYGRYV